MAQAVTSFKRVLEDMLQYHVDSNNRPLTASFLTSSLAGGASSLEQLFELCQVAKTAFSLVVGVCFVIDKANMWFCICVAFLSHARFTRDLIRVKTYLVSCLTVPSPRNLSLTTFICWTSYKCHCYPAFSYIHSSLA